MLKAITTGGFQHGDTVVVRTGYFGTATQGGREKQMFRQGFTTFYAATDTIVTAPGARAPAAALLRLGWQTKRQNCSNHNEKAGFSSHCFLQIEKPDQV